MIRPCSDASLGAHLQGQIQAREGHGRRVGVRGVALAGAHQDQQVAAALRRRQVRLLRRPRLQRVTKCASRVGVRVKVASAACG